MLPTIQIQNTLATLGGVSWSSRGEFRSKVSSREKYRVGWIKFETRKSELGWRTIEFVAWAIDDLRRGEYRVRLFPTSAPPYLNTPGRCLAFVIEVDLLAKGEKDAAHAARFLQQWAEEYWPVCKPRRKVRSNNALQRTRQKRRAAERER